MKSLFSWKNILFALCTILILVVWLYDASQYKMSPTSLLYSNEPFSSLNVDTKGPILSDPADQQLTQVQQLISSGRPFNTWNPYNAFGAPTTSWDIILNPFNWLYLFGLESGQIIKYFLKYILAFGGMVLFLKNKKLNIISSVSGGLVFCFSSAIIMWGCWPHSDVIAASPWAFYAVDKVLDNYYTQQKNISYRWLFLFCILIYFMLIAGMPTYAAYFIYIGGCYILYRIFSLQLTWIQKSHCILLFVFALFLAALMSFVYTGSIAHSTSQYQVERDGYAFYFLDWEYIRTLFLPYIRDGLSAHLNESTLFSGYLWLLVFPVWICIKEDYPEIIFWVVVASIALLLVFNYNIGYLFRYLPLIHSSSKIRVLVLLNFSLSIISSFVIEYIGTKQFSAKEKKKLSLMYFLLGICLILVFGDHISDESKDYNLYVYAVCLLLTLLGAIFCIGNLKKVGMSILILCTAFIGALFAKDYMPLIEKGAPIIPLPTDSIQYLTADLKTEERITGIDWILSPNTNSYYQLRDIRIHGFAATDEKMKNYYKRINADAYKTRTFVSFPYANLNLNLLAYSSVKYIHTSNGDYLRELDNTIKKANTKRIALPIQDSNQVIKQKFCAQNDLLSGINILFSTNRKQLDSNSNVNIKIIDLETEALISSECIRLSDIKDDDFFKFDFSPIPDSKSRYFQLELSLDNSIADPLFVWVTEGSYQNGDLYIAGDKMPGDLCCINDFGHVMQFEDNTSLLEISYCPRAYFVNNIIEKNNDDEILDYMANKLDMTSMFVRTGTIPTEIMQLFNETNEVSGTRSIDWVADDGDYIKLITDTDEDSMMVLTDYYTPDWHVYIDDIETEIYETNYLFRSIYVPSGEHTVEFKYHPRALYITAVVSVIGYSIFTVAAIILIYKWLYAKKQSESETFRAS